METIRKFRIPATPGMHTAEMPATADIFALKQDGNDLALFATVTDGENDNEVRTFVVAATGETLDSEIEGEKLYLDSVSFIHGKMRDGAAKILDTPYELHVWEIEPPDSQGRPVLNYPGKAEAVVVGIEFIEGEGVDEKILSESGKRAVGRILKSYLTGPRS